MTKRLTIALVALAVLALVVALPVSAKYYQVAKTINGGANVFIGEQDLTVTHALNAANGLGNVDTVPTNMVIGWWQPGATLATTAPTKTVDMTSRYLLFQVTPADFQGYTGNWYLVNPGGAGGAITANGAVFTVNDPQIAVRLYDVNQQMFLTTNNVVQGTLLQIGVDTNMYGAINDPAKRGPLTYGLADGYVDIKVKDPAGGTLNQLLNITGIAKSIYQQNVSTAPWIWGQTNSDPQFAWATGLLNQNNQYAYQPGTYIVTAESLLNNMKDNYKNAGADYAGKTISEPKTIQLVSDTVKIEANTDSVVRSKAFSVTVTGRPNTSYYLWVKSVQSLVGGYDNIGPFIRQNQDKVFNDTPYGAPPRADMSYIGNYQWMNGNGQTLTTYIANSNFMGPNGPYYISDVLNGTVYYGMINTSPSGTRVVEFGSSNWTKAQRYTIRVEQRFPLQGLQGQGGPVPYGTPGAQYKYDEVDVRVEKGKVTVVASGDQTYYLGEDVQLSGTNSESFKSYLFLTGPNLPPQGANMNTLDPSDPNNGVQNGNPTTFLEVDVLADNTWSWKWGTSQIALDAGTYTIYAVSQPLDVNHLQTVAYGTVSILIKKPFVSATASQSTVAQGDRFYITGTAEGQPSAGVQIWILGKNYAVVSTESVNSDSSFSKEIKQGDTENLYAGQYFVVVQHPMGNDAYDVAVDPANPDYVINRQLNPNAGGTDIFQIKGSGSLQGTDAADALVTAINDPNVDDTYTKLQFLIEVPVIRIDPVGDRHVGDKFIITATTNLAVDDDVLFEVYSSSFKPTSKSQSGEFSGATGVIQVKKGDGGLNRLTFPVDASTFKPDEYIVTASAVIQNAVATTLFNVLEGAPSTPVPTTPPIAPVTTAPPTVPPTQVTAVPSKTPTQPGFGALVALVGLGAVAFLVVRRH